MTDVVIPDSEVFRRFLEAAQGQEFEINPEQVQIDIIARILNATTPDEILNRSGAIPAREYLNTPFTLTGIKFNDSTYDAIGPDFYAILEGVTPDGEKLAITCGARSILAAAWKLNDVGALPIAVEIKQSAKPTSAGFYVMWLEAAPKSF